MNGQFGFNPAPMMNLTGHQYQMPGSGALANMEGAFSGDKQSVFANMRTYVENPSGHLITPTRYQNVSASGYAPVNTIGAFLFASKAGHLTNPIGKQTIVCLHHLITVDTVLKSRIMGLKPGKTLNELKNSSETESALTALLPLGVQKTAFHGANGRNEASVAIRGETEIKNFFGPIKAGERIYALVNANALGKWPLFILISKGNAYQAMQEYENLDGVAEGGAIPKFDFKTPIQYRKRVYVIELGTALEDSFWDRSTQMDFTARNNAILQKFNGKTVEAMDRALAECPMLKIMLSGEITEVGA
jgi:hypothetical protein